MTSSERISANLKFIDSKKNSIRKAILLLALEWKDLDGHLDSTEKCLEGCVTELESREKNLESIRESVIESNEELDLIRKSIESRVQELESKEKSFHAFQQEQIEDLKLKEKRVNVIRRWTEERIEDVELREERLSEKLEVDKKHFEEIQKSIDQRLEEVSLKDKHFADRSKEIDSIQRWIERRVKELDTKEAHVEERSKELELVQNLNEERCKELELKEKELDSVQKLNEERAEKLDSKEKQLNSVQKYINQCFKDFRSKNKLLKLDQKLFEELGKELELKEKQLEERSKKIDLKEKQFDNALHSHVQVEQVECVSDENVSNCSSADDQFVVRMDGRNLQMFLNECSKDHESMVFEVCRALQLSLDPAKLVLDAMEGFYPPHLKKGDVEFEEGVVRRSCILLLEQLMKISPQIQPHVKEEALKLAREWKVKMIAVASNSLEVLGFLHLLASYKLAFGFDTDELLKLFEVVAEHKQAPELCWVLGLADKVPDLIEIFVNKKLHLVAVGFIFAFKLVDKFPPVPLLKKYLKYSNKVARKICRMRSYSREAQDKAIDERVASIRAVIKCIVDHKLESKFDCKSLKKFSEQLLLQKESNKQIKQAYPIKTRAQQYSHNKFMSSTTAPVRPKASAPKINSNSPTLASILTNMDGKNLQLFLIEHLEEHDMMYKQVSDALEKSFDSGKLVLDAMQGFYPPHSNKGGVNIEASVIRSCIFLLELLMRLSPQIKPQVKEAALKLAVEWKANAVLNTKNPRVILGFLLLVGSYELASGFDADELRNLFQNVAEYRHAPELSQALGFSENIFVRNIVHSQKNIDQSASGNLQLNNTVQSSYVGPGHSMPGEVPESIRFASDPAKLILDAMQGCYHSNLEGVKSSKLNVMKRFIPWLRQLLGVSLEVKTHVKEEALKFAANWKAEVIKESRNHSVVWCFLLFLATYKLASFYNTNELLGFMEIVCDHMEAIYLFSTLGLAYEVPIFVRSLIERQLHLEAIRFIFAFNLVDKFPPIPLLKGHLTCAEESANKILKKGHNSLQAQNKATGKEINALKAVIQHIGVLKLESEYSTENLKARIEQLIRQKEDRTSVVESPASNSQTREQNVKKRIAPIPDHASNTQSQQHHAKKKLCRTAISAGTAPPNPPVVGNASPIQHPPCVFAAGTAPCQYWSRGSTVIPLHTSHSMSQQGSRTPSNWGFSPFSSTGFHFDSAPNFHARPFMPPGTNSHSWSVFKQPQP